MQPYFFNVRDGASYLDAVGHEFASLADARAAAVRYAADVMRDETAALLSGEDWRVELVNEHGTIVFSIVVFTFAP